MKIHSDILNAVAGLVLISVVGALAVPVVAADAAAEWKTVEIIRTGEMSDTSSPMFQAKDSNGPLGQSKITLRCADEGWGNVSLERVRGRIALDQQLGLKTWPEVTKALEKQGDAYLRGERMKFREIFVHNDSGPSHPRDELAAFGDVEKGYKYKFAKFDECSKVDSETLKPDQDCVVTLQIKDGPKKNGASGNVRYRSIKCVAKASTKQETPVTAPSEGGSSQRSGSHKKNGTAP